MIDLLDYQERFHDWQVNNMGLLPPIYYAAGMSEECGEILHAMRCRVSGPGNEGIRGFDDDDKYIDAIADGISDCMVYALQLATAHELDMEEILKVTFDKVLKRDWVKDKETGGEEPEEKRGSVFEH